jgi:phenylalanyl-tRNA synthetase alpha chain
MRIIAIARAPTPTSTLHAVGVILPILPVGFWGAILRVLLDKTALLLISLNSIIYIIICQYKIVRSHLLYLVLMEYSHEEVAVAAKQLKEKLETLEDKRSILRAPELGALYEQIKTLPQDQRASFGQEVNQLRKELESTVNSQQSTVRELLPIDVTAPFDVNTPADKKPQLLPAENSSRHPISIELDNILDIFYRMDFTAIESRQIDDDYHMFTSLNFPEGHPARDEYEDLDARHEHTFHQLEGVYVDKGINAGNLIATLMTFLGQYYGKDLEFKTQPFYFPFTEPSFELIVSCPFCDKKGCNVCSYSGWIELLGCGMIHPNVLKEAGIDPNEYTGFAWGMGIDRLVMMKYNIEDIRHFESANLKFLRQFS